MTPRTELTVDLPEQLTGRDNAFAADTWKRIVGLYSETEDKIATAFDLDLLIKYCLLEQEVRQLADMRKAIHADWEANQKAARKIKPKAAAIDEWLQMWGVVNSQLERFKSFDARLDGKRKLLFTLSQSLYLTPRSRAGVPPKQKEHEPPDEFGDKFDG